MQRDHSQDTEGNDDRWTEVIKFYQGLVADHAAFRPLLDFLTRISKSNYQSILYPSTSMASLGLSTAEDYATRCIRPMVYISYNGASFELVLQSGQGNTVRTQSIDSLEDEKTFHQIIDWLGIRIPGT